MKAIKREPATLILHEVSALHPLMNEHEFSGLVSDIELNGQLEPIKLYRGKVVDGRHRVKAALQLGLDSVSCLELPNNTTLPDLKGIVLSTEQRRHQSISQRACTAYLEMLSGSLGKMTQAEQARNYGISKVYLSKCKKVVEKLGTDVLTQLSEGKVAHVLVNGHYINYSCVIRLYGDLTRKAEKAEHRTPLNDLDVNYTAIDVEVRAIQSRKTKEEQDYFLRSWIEHSVPGEGK